MTIIEFCSNSAIENMAGAVLLAPDRIVLISENLPELERYVPLYKSILKNRGHSTEVIYQKVGKNNLSNCVRVFEELVSEYDDIVFDITGGDDTHLVAVGIILERYKGRVQCQRFNFFTDSIIDCDGDGTVSVAPSFDFSVEENINIYGGEVMSWDFDDSISSDELLGDDAIDDINAVWSVCKKNTDEWNTEISMLAYLCGVLNIEDELSFTFNIDMVKHVLGQRGYKFDLSDRIMTELCALGIINVTTEQGRCTLSFKNKSVKRSLTTAGRALEMLIAGRMYALRDESGNRLYNDVKMGVSISWQNPRDEEGVFTVNEIDVMAMRGAIPVFISCKNGAFDADELYKLSTVSERFGGKYAKKVLVTTRLESTDTKSSRINVRMDDMRIRCVSNADSISDSRMDKILRSLWIN